MVRYTYPQLVAKGLYFLKSITVKCSERDFTSEEIVFQNYYQNKPLEISSDSDKVDTKKNYLKHSVHQHKKPSLQDSFAHNNQIDPGEYISEPGKYFITASGHKKPQARD